MKGALQFVALQTSAKRMRACARPTAAGWGGKKVVFTCVHKCGNEDKLSHARARAQHAYANRDGWGGGGPCDPRYFKHGGVGDDARHLVLRPCVAYRACRRGAVNCCKKYKTTTKSPRFCFLPPPPPRPSRRWGEETRISQTRPALIRAQAAEKNKSRTDSG